MPSSTKSNKESELIFSPDPASFECTIRKEARSLSTDNNTSVSFDSAQPPSTQTPVPSTDSRSPLSIDNTNIPSTDTFHPISIDIPSQTSIDTELWAMVAPLILVWENNGDLHDQEGHLRNAAGQRVEAQGACNPWAWCYYYRYYITCKWGCTTQDVGWLQPSRSLLHQQISHPSSYHWEGFWAESAVLHTCGTVALPWTIPRASYGPSGEVRGSDFCY